MADPSIIPTKIQMELNVVLSVFFKETTKLSTIYLPRFLRSFLSTLLQEACIDFSGFDTHLTVPKSTISRLILSLKEPTSAYIRVADRKDIAKILRTVQVHHRACAFKQKVPEVTTPATDESLLTAEPLWPADLCSYQELNASVLKRTIRRDVTLFVHFITRRCVGSAGYKISYNVPDQDPDEKDFKPITVHLRDAAMVVELWQLIVNESQTEAMQNHKNLTPQDLITVTSTEQRFQPLLEEGYLVSGGPYRVGTLGAVIAKEGTLFGLSCHHVVNCISAVKAYEVVGNNKVQMVNAELDFCYFAFADSDTEVYNLANLKFDEIALRNIKAGESVMKLGGAATGITYGTFVGLTDYAPAGSSRVYQQHYEVQWEEGSKFSEAGDCGALYCVRRGSVFIPFAIHRHSDRDGSSYGSALVDTIEIFAEGAECRFINPPHAGHWSQFERVVKRTLQGYSHAGEAFERLI